MGKGEWERAIRRFKDNIRVERLLERIGEEVILPAYVRNYNAAGVKKETGRLKAALGTRGAPGNVFIIKGNSLITGVDYTQFRHFKWFIEGRKGFRSRTRKGLMFENLEGRIIRVHRVRKAPAHNVLVLQSNDREKIRQIWREEFGQSSSVKIRRIVPVSGEHLVVTGIK